MKTKLILPIIAAAALMHGCGPGFPIMTAEQEALVKNVDKLVKENKDLKKRLQAVESAVESKNDASEVRKSLAETNSSVEELRREMASVRGSMEESTNDSTRLKAEVDALKASSKAASERVAAIEAEAKEGARKIEEARAAAAEASRKALEAAGALEADRSARAAEKEAGPKTDEPYALYNRAQAEIKEKKYEKAAETLRAFLAAYPDNSLASNAQYWLAETYYVRGDMERAVVEFDKSVKSYPNGPKAAASLLKEALSFNNMGADKEARVLLKTVVDKYPGTEEAAIAQKHLDDAGKK